MRDFKWFVFVLVAVGCVHFFQGCVSVRMPELEAADLEEVERTDVGDANRKVDVVPVEDAIPEVPNKEPSAEGESTPAPTNTWTRLDLAQCQAMARKMNRNLRTAKNNLTSAMAGNRIAEAEVFAPKLDALHTITEENDFGEARAELSYLAPLGIEISPFLTERSNSDEEEQWSSNVGITLKRRLFAAAERWRLRMPLTTAERNLLQAENSLRLRERELDFSVMQSFLAVQRVQNRLKVRGARVTDAKAFLKVTEERVARGLTPRVDIVNAKINLNQAEADVLNDETNLRSQTESLLNILGAKVTSDLTIVPFDLNDKDAETFNLDADSVNTLAHHESLVNLRLGISQARVDIEIQKDLLRPRFDLSFTAAHQSEGANVFNEAGDETDPYRLQVTYTTALDGKKQDKARLEQLELSLENLQSNLVDEEHRLLLRLRSAHRNIDRLRTQLGLNRQRLESERSKLNATMVRYEDGDVDNLEVTRAKQTVDDAEINLINTQIDLVLAQEEYQSLLPPDLPVQTELTPP